MPALIELRERRLGAPNQWWRLMEIDSATLALVLLAALLHASWNAISKSSGDPLVNIAIVTSTGGLLALPFMWLLPLPAAETWIWLGFSAAIHFVYQLGLVRMYRLGELSQVYPIARGLAPLGVALLGAGFANETLGPHQILGLLIAATAIIVLGRSGTAWGAPNTHDSEGRGTQNQSRQAVWTAIGVAALIGLYTFSDGQGVRTVDNSLQYIAWSAFLGCVPFALVAAYLRRDEGMGLLTRDGGRETLRAVGGGLMATVGYGIALFAMSRTPMALVSSLRESSVLFAAVIGTVFLREAFGRRRILAALALVIGLVMVQLSFD